MADVKISNLPPAGPLTGDEEVPIVQMGITRRTTTSDIAFQLAGPGTVTNVATGTGLTGGPITTYGTISIANTGVTSNTYGSASTSARFNVNPQGQITYAEQVPITVSYTNVTGLGTMATQNANNVSITGGTIDAGTLYSIVQQGVGGTGFSSYSNGQVLIGNSAGGLSRTTITAGAGLEVINGDGSITIGAIGGGIGLGTVTNVATGTGLTGGPITTTGTISLGNTTVVSGSYGSGTNVPTFTVNAQGQLTAAANEAITPAGIGAVASVSGTANEITSSGTTNVTLSLPAALTFTGKTVTDGTFNMTAATVGSDTVTTNTASQALTNKTISGSSNTLTNIANSSLTNSSVTVGTTAISLGATSLTLDGLTSVTVTQEPTSDYQLATKLYVDNVAQGLNVKASCLWGTTADITLSGLSTQAGGEWTGSLTAGDRILVKNQSTSADNGIYVAAAGPWARAADANTWNELISAFTFIQTGATLINTGWVCNISAGGTLGVTPVTWSQFSGAGTYTAGTGLTLAGNQFSITPVGTASTYGSASQVPVITTNASGQVSSVTNTSIAIAASQVTSGTLAVAQGGTNIGSYATGDLLYASGSTTLAPLTIGASGYVLTSSGTAPQYVAQSTLSVGSATNATNAANTGITANSTNATNYLTFVSATTGNLPQLVNSSITCNPSTGNITSGISGGTF